MLLEIMFSHTRGYALVVICIKDYVEAKIYMNIDTFLRDPPTLNIAKYFKTLRCGCGAVAFIFSIYFKPEL